MKEIATKSDERLSEFEQIVINAKTGPMKSIHRQLSSQLVYDHLVDSLSSRFKIEILPFTRSINVVDEECRSQFSSNDKYYYIMLIDDKIVLNFSSKFDYLEGLSSSQIEFIESNDVEIEIFKDRVYLSCFVLTIEDLANKIRFLADVLKDFH